MLPKLWIYSRHGAQLHGCSKLLPSRSPIAPLRSAGAFLNARSFLAFLLADGRTAGAGAVAGCGGQPLHRVRSGRGRAAQRENHGSCVVRRRRRVRMLELVLFHDCTLLRTGDFTPAFYLAARLLFLLRFALHPSLFCMYRMV